MATWHTPTTARDLAELWPDVDALSDETLTVLLDVAQAQVIAYAPALPADVAPDGIPSLCVLGQLQQAKNVWNAARVDASGGVGDGSDFVIRPTPLDWHIKQLLRPKKGRPRVR